MASAEKYTVGVDVGGTSIRIGQMTQDLRIVGISKMPLGDVLYGDDQPDKLARFIANYCRSMKDRDLVLSAVAVGLPGTLDRECERVLNTPNIPGLIDSNLKRVLEEYLKTPVFLENDTVMLLSGDAQRLGFENESIIMGCYIGTGLGSAIFINGSVPKGKNGINELGHVPIFGKDELCNCGNRGCAENYVSGRYLQKLKAEKYPNVHISDIFTAMKGTPEYYEYIEILSVILASSINLIDPNALIIGGGVAAMKDFPKAELFERIYFHTMKPVPAKNLNILYSLDNEDAGVFGAALFAERMLEIAE